MSKKPSKLQSGGFIKSSVELTTLTNSSHFFYLSVDITVMYIGGIK